jgi:hypothetical protein
MTSDFNIDTIVSGLTLFTLMMIMLSEGVKITQIFIVKVDKRFRVH